MLVEPPLLLNIVGFRVFLRGTAFSLAPQKVSEVHENQVPCIRLNQGIYLVPVPNPKDKGGHTIPGTTSDEITDGLTSLLLLEVGVLYTLKNHPIVGIPLFHNLFPKFADRGLQSILFLELVLLHF